MSQWVFVWLAFAAMMICLALALSVGLLIR